MKTMERITTKDGKDHILMTTDHARELMDDYLGYEVSDAINRLYMEKQEEAMQEILDQDDAKESEYVKEAEQIADGYSRLCYDTHETLVEILHWMEAHKRWNKTELYNMIHTCNKELWKNL